MLQATTTAAAAAARVETSSATGRDSHGEPLPSTAVPLCCCHLLALAFVFFVVRVCVPSAHAALNAPNWYVPVYLVSVGISQRDDGVHVCNCCCHGERWRSSSAISRAWFPDKRCCVRSEVFISRPPWLTAGPRPMSFMLPVRPFKPYNTYSTSTSTCSVFYRIFRSLKPMGSYLDFSVGFVVRVGCRRRPVAVSNRTVYY